LGASASSEALDFLDDELAADFLVSDGAPDGFFGGAFAEDRDSADACEFAAEECELAADAREFAADPRAPGPEFGAELGLEDCGFGAAGGVSGGLSALPADFFDEPDAPELRKSSRMDRSDLSAAVPSAVG